ncbi:MAG: VWA domain-containing protein [Chloracidobacterium sp.]|nr:VWA domain-containing protein [Chloracidobacterium sp.]MCO5333969.1 VWA domain-containing protein [Pyrinomonadaceae bacterium]
MRKALFGLPFLLAFSILSHAQTPTPTPAEDDNVVKISTSLIQLDATFVDSKGNAVRDIRRDEVEVYENGRKQAVSGFSFVNVPLGRAVQTAAVDKNAPPVPQAQLRPENIHRTIALVVDDLSLSFTSVYETRRSLKKFVDEQMQIGDLVAIVRTGAGVGALQQFTSDKRLLYAAIERVRWNPLGTGGIGAFAPISAGAAAGDDDTADSDETEIASGSGESLDDYRSRVFATGTLGALRFIVQGMGQLPGRKSVILFSDGFRLFEKTPTGAPATGMVMDFVRQLIDQANRSSVVFYTVDGRGLQVPGFTAEDNPERTDPASMEAALAGRRDQLFETQEGLTFLAEETGGFAVRNQNDLSGGVRKILNDQSYYLIAYEPDDETFDSAKRRFNKIEIKVLRKGVTARYRSGFFNVADKPADAVVKTLSPVAQLQSALVSPFAVNGIDLKFTALFANNAQTGSFVRSLLHVDGTDLKFVDEKDGLQKISFDVLVVSFGDSGQPVDSLAKTYTMTVKPAAAKKIKDHGFNYYLTFPVKKPGAYQLRVALRDPVSGAVGSASQFIEVPNIKKSKVALSSIIIENLTPAEWKDLSSAAAGNFRVDSLTDTAVRRIKQNSVLLYAYQIYNARTDASRLNDMKVKVRVFRDGKLILDGAETALDTAGQTDLSHIDSGGSLAIGRAMQPGDYILQVVVMDKSSEKKPVAASQYIQFEVVGD